MGANETITAQFGAVTVSIPARDLVRRIALEALNANHGAPASAAIAPAMPRLGEYWEAEGGIYAGRLIGDDDQVYALIVARRADGEFESIAWEPAKLKAAALDLNDFTDWKLPNRMEALAMYQRLHELLKGSEDVFSGEAYWTSTQHAVDSGYAWYQDFGWGNQGNRRKSTSSRARAVRRAVLSN